MIKRTIILILFLGLVLTCYFLVAPKDSINQLNCHNGLLTQTQRDIIFNQIRLYPNKTQMAISFIKGDSCIYYGAIKNNDIVSEIDNKYSSFEIGSITKVFTTTLLADFVLDSILTYDRYINDDLDFNLNNDIKISYKELANHTSGLPRKPSDLFFSAIKSPLNPNKYYDVGKLESYLKKRLKVEEGFEFEYSNLGVGILGYVLCKVAKTNYETLLNEKILTKYGLTNTTSIRENISDKLVVGLNPLGFKTPNWDLASLKACGGLLSSVDDLTKFVQAQFDTTNLELALTRESTFVLEDSNEIGLGWFILKDKSVNNWYFHNGATGGYRSSLVFDTDNKTGIIILTNISMGHRKDDLIDGFCFELMKSITPASSTYRK